MKGCVVIAAAVAFGLHAPATARDILVRDARAYVVAVPALKPGDTLILADGEWRDFAAVFSAQGEPGKPITLRSQTPGKVVLTGRSSLAVSGRHLIVANLVFRDGFAAKTDVVATRAGKQWAENVRLTGLVIDNFTNPDRRFEDHWVALYGRNIRVDHSHFVGKANAGAMMIVVREQPWPLDNAIQIDHNYFGPRPVLGANGGETIRIGTSTESLSDSGTVVEDNLFERCDGEVEIVSVKSGANIIRRNSFIDSQGAVVLRHGNGNLVERNVFFGHGLAHTGGIRVINERQTVRNNYLEGLKGQDFTSALTVMNGVPNSPINRYMPVRDATIAGNSFIDVAAITFGAGASAERSVPPASTRFERNLVTGSGDPFRVDASIAGIAVSGNVANRQGSTPQLSLAIRELELARAPNGLLYPTDTRLADVGAPRDLMPVHREATGVPWYPKPASSALIFRTGGQVAVANGGSLPVAIARTPAGGTIQLAAGHFHLSQPLVIDRPLTIAGSRAVLSFSSRTLFQLKNGGSLRLEGLTLDGSSAAKAPGNALIRSSAQPMTANYVIELNDCTVRNLAIAPGFDVISTTPATLAGRIVLSGETISDVSGAVIAGHSETGKDGYYNAERVTIAGTKFDRVATVVDLYRGGTDESTYGPQLSMSNAIVTDSGLIRLSGVQQTKITRNTFVRSKGISVIHSVGSPHTEITGNRFDRTPAPTVEELDYRGPPRAVISGNQVVQ